MKEYLHLFGPVASRRFGRSLGIDLVPMKVCSENCIFCQLGPTHQPVTTRSEYVPLQEVLGELEDWLQQDGRADFISLAGSGEPTLHSGFGEVLQKIRSLSSVPTALLSNGTLFSLPEVRQAATAADVVKVSLSAWDQPSFEKINRPARGLDLATIITGYQDFRQMYDGQLWVEVFVVPGVNDAAGQMQKIAAITQTIRPDRIHLNTAIRPPEADWVTAAADEQLVESAKLFTPRAEVPHDPHETPREAASVSRESVLALLRRHPAGVENLARCFGVKPTALEKLLTELHKDGLIIPQGNAWRAAE